ncbi:MAG: hypothetical protein QXI55_03485 [Thermofilum sp.]
MLLVEVLLPKYVHRRIASKLLRQHREVVKSVIRHTKTRTAYVLLEETPKGWWLALRILKEGAGRLYILREVKYLDIPSKIMELSFKDAWDPEYSQVIEEELKKWGVRNG